MTAPPPSFYNNISMTMPTPELNAEVLYLALAAQIKSALAGIDHAAIVGIHSGGAWLAQRLADELQLTQRLGFIDVSFYRDDFSEKGLHAEVKPTQIPFEVDGAAINELFDYGRPAKIMLAALVDRGGRELPIAADFVAETISLNKDQSLVLQRTDSGQLTLTIDHA